MIKYDIIIRNARIIDGSGTPSFEGVVAINGERIAAIGRDIPGNLAKEVVDADGRILAPGFIDAHGHSEISLLANPSATGKISQGITTEIAGNCGLSAFPVTDRNRSHLEEIYRNYGVRITWDDVSGYSKALNRGRPALNLLSLCGHNTLRAAVIGYERRTPSRSDLDGMRALLSDSLAKGACGFSTGLIYIPGKFAETPELVELLGQLSSSGKVHTTHLRSEGDRLLEAIDEVVDACGKAGQKSLHISHLKTSHDKNWSKLGAALDRLRSARGKGLLTTADRYPYTEGQTTLSVVAPAPFDALDDATLQNRLADPAAFAEISEKLRIALEGRWGGIRIVDTKYAPARPHLGEKLLRISEATGIPPHALCAEALRADAIGTQAAFAGMSEDNMRQIVSQEFVCCGSDESARPADFSIGRSHPRGFGSLPRFLNLTAPAIGWEKAIERVTSMPAGIFGVAWRGLLRQGYFADMVLLDPERLKDNATFAAPHKTASGILKVWVNGALTMADGSPTGLRSGRFLTGSNA